MIYRSFERFRAKIRRVGEMIRKRLQVRMATKHVSGPRRIKLGADDVALVCMLKNGSYYLDKLLEHHRALGISHFLFIDNGSEDDTCESLAAEPGVSLVSNHLPVGEYESLLRSRIARRFIKGGWFLFVDSDELIEMINGAGRNIRDYARYCNDYGYDAVDGQCLDLFPSRPLSETEDWSYKKSISEFKLFSLNCIENYTYHSKKIEFSWFLQSNKTSNPEVMFKFGGIRREIFGENCALTNHRMIKNEPYIDLYIHPHCSSNIHCADFTLLLRHYKFAGQYIAREKQQLDVKTWNHNEGQLRRALISDPSFTFSGKEIQRFAGADQLVDQGFMTCSQAFLTRFPPRNST